MPRFGLAAGVTASPDLAQQRVLTRRRLAAVASVAIVLTGMVNSLLHEAAHAVAGMAQGLTPTISPFSVSYEPEGTAQQQIIGAAAGPLFARVRNTYDPLDLSRTLRIPIAAALAVVVLNVALAAIGGLRLG
jgi:hypothetical protein